MKRYASGMVVGKFAPLHSGHEALINAALEQCRRSVSSAIRRRKYAVTNLKSDLTG